MELEMSAPFRMGDHGHITAAFDPVAGLLDEFRRHLIRNLNQKKPFIAERQWFFQVFHQKLVKIVLPSREKQQLYTLPYEFRLKESEGCPDRCVVCLECPLDQMRRTMYGSVTRLTQGPCHFHRFGHGSRPVVNAGQQMTMPVCQPGPPLSSLFIGKPALPRLLPLRRAFLLPIISIPIPIAVSIAVILAAVIAVTLAAAGLVVHHQPGYGGLNGH